MGKSVETISAERFDAIAEGGATKPLRMSCVSGVGQRLDVYVRYSSEACPVGGLARELIGNLLAKQIGVAVAEIAFVNVSNELVELIHLDNPGVAKRLIAAVDPKLGSISVGAGFQLCSTQMDTAPAFQFAAFKLWVLDELIFNVDRTQTKPNCLFKGHELIAIDHEKSLNLSQLGSFLCPPMPWDSSWQPNKHHVFYEIVRKTTFDFTAVRASWSLLNVQMINGICSTVPISWGANEIVEQIRGYLFSLHEKIEDSLENLRSSFP